MLGIKSFYDPSTSASTSIINYIQNHSSLYDKTNYFDPRKPKLDQNKKTKVLDIVKMGFTMDQVQNALHKTDNGSKDIMVDYILNNHALEIKG